MVQLPIFCTPAVVPVEKKCQAAQSLISSNILFCLKILIFLAEKNILILAPFLLFFEKMKLYCAEKTKKKKKKNREKYFLVIFAIPF